MRARTLRWVAQGLFLAVFLLLFALTAFPLRSPFPVDLLLRLDPLAAIISFLATRTIVSRMLLSLALLGATILLGRFFCGYICPLGTAIDLADIPLSSEKLSFAKLKTVPRIPKYYLLIFLLSLALFGRALLWPLDPLVIFTRGLVSLFHPAALFLANWGLDLFRPLAERWELDVLADAGFQQPSYALWIVPAVLLAIVLGLGLLGRRFWCRSLCPMGALLAFAAHFSPLKRVIDKDRCTHCHLCRKRCPMNAVGQDELDTFFGECIECRACKAICPQEAVSFRFVRLRSKSKFDLDRRRIVTAAALGFTAFCFSRIVPGEKSRPDLRIRPPGAVPEAIFLSRCLRCGECMKVCITNGLQPSVEEAGFVGLWTPVLVPRKGPCERRCNMCGKVCPTQAIRSLSTEEKSYARIGRAAVDRSRCLEWGFGKACLVCDEVCPYGAIFVGKGEQGGESRRGPVVDADNCVGCGVCEQHCPVPREAAIRVSGTDADRLLEGSYITPQKKRSRQRTLSGET